MRCAVHTNREAIAVCQSCGNALCSDCRITITGIAYCQSCLDAGRIRRLPHMTTEHEDGIPTPLGNVTATSRRNLLIGVLGMSLIALFIHFQWLFNYGYYGPPGTLNYSSFIPHTLGSVLVATGIFLSAFAWYEFKYYFNFRWAFFMALFTFLTPWWGVVAELLFYSGFVVVSFGPYGNLGAGPLAPVYNNLVLVSSTFFGVMMILWAVLLLYVRKNSHSPKLTFGSGLIYLILAHMTLLIIPAFLPSLSYYPILNYGYNYSFIPSIIIEIGVILNAIFFYRLAASLKPY